MKTRLIFLAVLLAVGAQAASLWQIGGEGTGNAGLALAPNHFDQFDRDGFFVVGASDAKQDWPYVQPGPADGWAGGCEDRKSVV